MKKTKFIAGLAMGLICSSAYAIDSWEGDKFIYSKSAANYTAFKINIEGNRAKVISDSQSEGVVSTKKGKIKITFDTGSMRTQSYLQKKNPVTGQTEEVFATNSVEQITISGKKDDLRMKIKGESCYQFQIPNDVAHEVCETSKIEYGKKSKLVLKSKLKKIKTKIAEASNIVLPLPEFNSAFVTIGADGAVTPAQQGVPANRKIIQLAQNNKKIIATMADGSQITYGRTAEFEGVTKVIGVLKQDGSESLVIGLMAKDEKVAVTRDMLTGTYTPIHAKDISYIFNDDGFGSFISTDSEGNKQNNPWVWELVNDELVAKRYKFLKNDAYLSLGEEGCRMFNERSYKVLSKKGDTFVLLRKMISPRGDDNEPSITQHVQVMKLKKNKTEK